MKKTFPVILLMIVFLISSSIYIIKEGEQAIVTQFGKPVSGAISNAGLKFKIPLIQKVIKFDKRILEWDSDAREIPTKDNKYIYIDAFARWRIVDPLQFYKSAKNEMIAQSRLDDVLDGIVRDEISNRMMTEIIRSTDREMSTYEDSENLQNNLEKGARIDIVNKILYKTTLKLSELGMGIEVLDVQLKRIDYNKQVQVKLFNRMISEQNMIAEKYRAQGEGKKQEILGTQIHKEKEIISGAYLKSQIIRGEADAEAIKIYAKAYNQDPEFYDFVRSLDAYELALDKNTRLILSSDSEFLKFLK